MVTNFTEKNSYFTEKNSYFKKSEKIILTENQCCLKIVPFCRKLFHEVSLPVGWIWPGSGTFNRVELLLTGFPVKNKIQSCTNHVWFFKLRHEKLPVLIDIVWFFERNMGKYTFSLHLFPVSYCVRLNTCLDIELKLVKNTSKLVFYNSIWNKLFSAQ